MEIGQSHDKIDLEYMNPRHLNLPTLKGVPRMYDLMSGFTINEWQNFHQNNDPTQGHSLNKFYTQYQKPYQQYRKNFPCTEKYGFVEPDPLENEFNNINQNNQTNLQQNRNNTQFSQTYQGDPQSIRNTKLIDKYSQQQQYNGQQQQQQIQQQPGERKVQTVHIGLDHPDNPYVNQGQIVPQEKKTVVVQEYYPIKNWKGNKFGLEKYLSQSTRPQPQKIYRSEYQYDEVNRQKQEYLDQIRQSNPKFQENVKNSYVHTSQQNLQKKINSPNSSSSSSNLYKTQQKTQYKYGPTLIDSSKSTVRKHKY